MPRLEVISDDDLDQLFSQPIAEQMRGSIYSGGDCRACGRTLQTGQKVRLEAATMPGSWTVWARHATCSPTVGDNNQTVLFTPHTWATLSVGVPMAPMAEGRSFFRKKPAAELMPMVILNPSVDGFSLAGKPGEDLPRTLPEKYFAMGFDQPGTTNIRVAQKHPFTCRINGDSIEFDLFPYGDSYSATLHPDSGADLIRKQNGLLLLVTHAASPGEITNAQEIQGLMQQPEHYATTWLPLQL